MTFYSLWTRARPHLWSSYILWRPGENYVRWKCHSSGRSNSSSDLAVLCAIHLSSASYMKLLFFTVPMVFIIPKGTWGNHYFVLWKPWNHTLPFCGTLLTPHPLLFMPIHSTKDAAFWKAASSARAGVHIHTAPYGRALTHILPMRPVRIFFQHNWSGHCRIEMHINAAIRASATAACNVKACKLISNSCHRRAKCSIQYLIMVHNNHSNSHVVGHTE